MAVIKISKKCLCALSGICADEAEPILTEIGIPIDSQIGDIMSLEITPNRPDWLSVEGIARSCHSYKFATAKQYEAQKSKISFKTTPAIKKVRPFLGSALVKNVNLNDEILDSLIQLQEKLHDTLGRQRKKMAIGLHDVSKVESPFTYTAQKLEEESFTPLGMQSPLTFNQILFQHEKGKKYAHLVGDLCPVIKDKNNEVLSFPPIINGELTKVTKKTTDLLIDCTGTHGRTVQVAVNILAAAFADWGAQIYSVQIDGKPYPIFEPIQTSFSSKDANSLLGLNLSDAQLKHHLARMGHTLKGKNVFSPAFRADIIGATDLIEDIAISYGYNNFKPSLPDFVSIGKLAPVSAAHESAIGLGYFEVSSWILTNKKTLEKSQIPQESLSVKNPLTEDFTTLRPALYPNLLEIFANSKSQPMPQCLYELGPIIKKQSGEFSQFTHLAFANANPKSNFSQIHSHLLSLLSSLAVRFELKEKPISGFITGRCAAIIIDSKEAGIIGEVHPQVLENFSIEQPVALFELDCAFLP